MSETKAVTETPNQVKGFAYRNIKKDFYQPTHYDSVDLQFHLELGEKNEAVIVEDRKIDWVELSNKDIDQVGLANILAMAAKRGLPPDAFMFKDEEAFDTSMINPMDPDGMTEVLAKQDASKQKLDNIAKQLGVTTDTLVKAFMEGNFADLVAKATEEKTQKKEDE